MLCVMSLNILVLGFRLVELLKERETSSFVTVIAIESKSFVEDGC